MFSPSAIFFALFINFLNGFTNILDVNKITTVHINIYDIEIIKKAIFPLWIAWFSVSMFCSKFAKLFI